MELTAAEGRVLGCLIALQDAPSAPPTLSLDELRFMCNQTHRADAAVFDDRTVDDALVSLKSKGLVRFVLAGRNLGPVRYRHRADDRWRLGEGDLAVLAVLLLDGPQTADEVRARLGNGASAAPRPEDGHQRVIDVDAALDALAGRTPMPFATRVAPPAWGGETLWAEVLTGQPAPEELYQIYERRRAATATNRAPASGSGSPQSDRPAFAEPPRRASAERHASLADVVDRLTKIERRLAGIEAELAALRSARSSRPSGQESSRMIR